ncbi:hypothetical protein LWI29_020323 [Acer saccharum]|uniref:RNase H type-1 domain-containing protein n=1 Tax=Acer saccharum TaxID=4024 RepID=A0AA39SMQ9_ACESA|nr:hypothetical protein LWI29_020323 [Acer saccharum]
MPDLVIEGTEEEESGWTSGHPAERLEEIQIRKDDPTKVVKIGGALDSGIRRSLIELLEEYNDIFAWNHDEMPSIPLNLAVHRLAVDATVKPVKQKRRHFNSERNIAVQGEVDKLLKAGFIRESCYPEWIANVVMVTKANGKWRMCVDYTDLNRACPKDSFPLPKIDQLIDSTAGNKLLSFMDAFSGYNQIMIHPANQDKTSFIIRQGLYCYKVMPFGLKNVGTTYQRLVNKLFKPLIGRSMEVYIDDMITKSQITHQHPEDLRQTFQVIRENQMRLNPTKCAFGVVAGKFLGFMMHERGIEANPEKIKAIMDLESPSTLQQAQGLTGRIAALNRFISRSINKCLPFFKIIKQGRNMKWDQEGKQAFQALKEYLASPPLLVKPLPGEELQLYLAVSLTATSGALVKECSDGAQRPIYYVSRAPSKSEKNYTILEKLAFALVTTARKLRPYFQAHTVVVVTDQPLRQFLQRPDVSGRLVLWALELTQYDIRYKARTTIKAQALADFVAEFSMVPHPDVPAAPGSDPESLGWPTDCKTWIMYTDGSSNQAGYGAGIVLIDPEGIECNHCFRFEFKVTNNEAEYEALLAGIKVATKLGVEYLVVRSDSQLIINQVSGTYQARGDNMIAYLRKVREAATKFKGMRMEQIPREKNHRADVLAKIAATEGRALPKGILLQLIPRPSTASGLEVSSVVRLPCWMDPIADYL